MCANAVHDYVRVVISSKICLHRLMKNTCANAPTRPIYDMSSPAWLREKPRCLVTYICILFAPVTVVVAVAVKEASACKGQHILHVHVRS
jgi:hypothetical protein